MAIRKKHNKPKTTFSIKFKRNRLLITQIEQFMSICINENGQVPQISK